MKRMSMRGMIVNKVVVGLGNPGITYAQTKHNTGFLVLDELVAEAGGQWKENKKFKAQVSEYGDYLLVKPQTGMNRSGFSVSKVLSFYKIVPKDMFVVHDDVDFPPLEYKKQFGKDSAGHKGVEDIIDMLGTKDFWRVRVGVGRPENSTFDVEEYVLSGFSDQQLAKLREISLTIFEEIKQS